MKILIIGSGAREHAIIKRLAQDSQVYCVMPKKNPGIVKLCKKIFLADIENPLAVTDAIKGETFDLAFASPDAVLAAGVSDALIHEGIKVASPTKAAARIEWDKSHMRKLTEKYSIKGRIKFRLVKTEKEARETIEEFGEVAIKPLGLTGGKGVKVSGDHFQRIEEGMEYVHSLLQKDKIALIEEKVEGEEFSLMCFSDGKTIAPMPPVQDHKRAFLADTGPNTGGMGSYSTGAILPFLEQSDIDEAHEILQRTIDAMANEGTPFKGVLYGQFMATKKGIRIIEFNARFADPESMNVLALLEGSLSQILMSIAEGKLIKAKFSNDATVVKYLVPNGYPDKPLKDQEVKIDEAAAKKQGAEIYFASVYEKDNKTYLGGSRTFGILGRGKTLDEAERIAEEGCGFGKGPIWHRKDIGTKKLVQKRIDHMRRIRS
ncbi:phosphoribosylamine--glycine ligase [Candidatus Micrarchaeota archaeon]|nr:phosphoribosylamine--glycine ligase [Candidatus Micrarchaeota archaeon]